MRHHQHPNLWHGLKCTSWPQLLLGKAHILGPRGSQKPIDTQLQKQSWGTLMGP